MVAVPNQICEEGKIWLLIRSSVAQGGNAMEKIPFNSRTKCEAAAMQLEGNDAFAGGGARILATQWIDAR